MEFRGVYHAYQDQEILQDFSLSLPSEGRVALRGPSGCGKTTLLRLMAGLEKPTRGSIEGLKGLRFSYVFQEPRLLPWKTAQDNIACLLGDLPLKEARRRAGEWLERLDLADSKEKFPHECSGGMQQRIAIARALAMPSDVLLLDEPMRGLDPQLQERVKELFLNYSGRLTVMVTHDGREAEGLAEQEIWLEGPPLRVVKK